MGISGTLGQLYELLKHVLVLESLVHFAIQISQLSLIYALSSVKCLFPLLYSDLSHTIHKVGVMGPILRKYF